MFGFGFSLTKLASAAQAAIAYGARVAITGTKLFLTGGTELYPRGVNQGTWGQNYSIDAPAIAGYGANHVRLLIRSNLGGTLDSYETGTDAYVNNGTDYLSDTHKAQFLQEIDWAGSSQLWSIVAFDTDQGQGVGRQTLPTSYWDFFDGSPEAAAAKEKFFKGWEWIATQCRGREYILCYELLPEPIPYNSTADDAIALRAFYRELIARVRAIDPNTPFLIGGRNSYGTNTVAEAYLSERTDCIYTIDLLTNRVEAEDTIAATLEGFRAWLDSTNVPGLIQQLGRNTGEDEGAGTTTENAGLTAMCGSMSLCNALHIPYTWWQYHQNTDSQTAYGLWFKTVYPGTGPLNWTPKPAEIAAFQYHMTQSPAAIEAAAVAAATAAGAELYYIKPDFSNIWQTQDTSTPVTAVGQAIGRVAPVVGTTNLNQSTSTLRPLLAATRNGYAMQFDGTDDWLGLSVTYFAADDNATVMAACRPASTATNKVIWHTGTSGSIVRTPYLASLATDEIQASWRGDTNESTGSINSTTLCDDRAIVATAQRVGGNKKCFLQGVQEGATNTGTVSSIASITRSRFGGSSSGTNCFQGPIALLCIGKTITDEQRRAISRWGAWLISAPFRGAIPA
jgi:hypothetical protein